MRNDANDGAGCDAALGPTAQLILDGSSRIIAIAGYVDGSGVSTAVERLATILTRAQATVAVVNLSETAEPIPANDASTAAPSWWSAPALAPGGYARVGVNRNVSSTDYFYNVPLVRRALDGDFASFTHVLMDLGTISSSGPRRLPALGAAAAADALFLVCLRGITTRPQIIETAGTLGRLGIVTTGVIVNEGGARRKSKRKYRRANRHDLASHR